MNKPIVNAVGSLLSSSAAGQSVSIDKHQPPVWGRITAAGPYSDHPEYYEWEEVYPDDQGVWRAYDEVSAEYKLGQESVLKDGLLYNPAVEINGHGGIEVGTIVRLIPAQFLQSEAAKVVHRAWLFASPQTLVRPFRLRYDLVPAGGSADDTYKTPADLTIEAEWLDAPGEYVTLYPAHRSVHHPADNFLSHGIGRGPGAYFRGTYGWAKYNPTGTAYTDDDGSTKYRGEWQIVTLYAETIATAVIYSAAIDSGDVGDAQLWWIDKNQLEPELINSTYQIDVFNDLLDTLQVGDRIKVYFDRNSYVWRPITGSTNAKWCKVQTGGVAGGNGSASRVVTARHCDWDGGNVVAPDIDVNTLVHPTKDTALFDDDVFEYCVADDGTLVSRGDIYDDPIGTVKWEAVDTANIRAGWHLCDGAGGTVDLQAKFIMSIDEGGAAWGDSNGIGDTGGSPVFTVSHKNWGDSSPDVAQAVVDDIDERNGLLGGAANPDMANEEVDNRPPYYVLAAIQRVS